jgi:hypothetical protein
MQLRMQLATIQKGDVSVAAYFRKVKSITDTLAVVGKRLDDDEIITYMLSGLGLEYESLVTSLTTRTEVMTVGDVYAHMLSAELRIDNNQGSAQGGIQVNQENRSPGRGINNGAGRGRGRDRGNGGARGNGGGRGNGGRGNYGNTGRSSGGQRPACQICGLNNHDASTFYHRFDHNFQPRDTTRVAAAVTNNSNSYMVDSNWYVDTGATDHIMNDLEKLTIKERYGGSDQVQVANGAGLSIAHVGNSSIASANRSLLLKNILHVPNIDRHLLSVHELTSDNNAYLEFHPNYFLVKDRATKTTLLRGSCEDGLYCLPNKRSSRALFTAKESEELWHQRLGHPSLSVVRQILVSSNLNVATDNQHPVCDTCQQGKAHQLPFSLASHVASQPLQLVHMDVWGRAHTSVNGFKYYFSIVDDFSRFVWIYFLKHKTKVQSTFLQFHAHVEKLTGKKLLAVQSD